MQPLATDLYYTESHEWLHLINDHEVVVGITDHAQHLLGDIVFVELPTADQAVTQGEGCCVVESVKSASDVYSPISGTITTVNTNLQQQPELVNQKPYSDGWLFRVKASELAAKNQWLSAAEYQQLIADE